jgi:APA family basic amino acid/polyamine antiporter
VTTPTLHKVIKPSGYFALSFGAIVGSGWVMLLGEWLRMGGPGGAIIAFIAGGALMLLVGACYGELSARMPIVGGEFTYASQVLGPRTGFVVGWFLVLFMLGICGFEGIALGWLLETLFPMLKTSALYVVAGEKVTGGSILIGVIGCSLIAFVNLQAVGASMLIQRLITFTFIAVSIAVVGAGLALGDDANLTPFFPTTPETHWLTGSLWIFSTCAIFLNGFQTALHVVEERAPEVSMRQVVIAMVAGIAAAAVFYVLLVLSASRAVPWQPLTHADMPAADAFGGLPGGAFLRVVVLAVATISLFKTWNALMLMASRMLYALATAGYLPSSLGRLNKAGVPAHAVMTVTVLSIVGLLVGRGAVIPIVNTATICISISLVISLLVLLRLRTTDTAVPSFQAPGGRPAIVIALVGMAAMAVIAAVDPLLRAKAFPIEWVILLGWGALSWLFLRRPPRPLS